MVKLQGEDHACAETSLALTDTSAEAVIDLGTDCAGHAKRSGYRDRLLEHRTV